MIKVPLSRLRPGMKLARAVLGSDGNVLLAAGIRIKPAYIRALEMLGYTTVFVAEPGLEDVHPPELIREQTRISAIQLIRETFYTAKGQHGINVRRIRAAVDDIVDEVLYDRDALVHLGDIRGHDNATFAHSVNVAVLCCLIGRGMGYNRTQLVELTLGGLLHDVGKIFIPPEILNKEEPLTGEEIAIVRRHPRDGFELLRTTPGIPLRSAHMALQHHELMDGSGYPRGLKGHEIHPYARINAVADAFDALTSDRPYRLGVSPMQALNMIHELRATHYDPKVIAVLRSFVAPYPVGSKVRLSTGDRAVVVAVQRDNLERPDVRIIERNGVPQQPPYEEVKLSQRPDVAIVDVEEP